MIAGNMPDVQNVALGNHPIQIPSGNNSYNILQSIDISLNRVPRHPEAVHQGGDQDPAPGPPALVRCLLPVHGEGGGAPGQGQARVPSAEH